MSDDRRDDEQEQKITVRDRRRVTTEGELREVPETPAPTEPEATPPASGPRLVDDAPEPPKARRPERAPQAEMPHLRDVSGAAEEEEAEDEAQQLGADGMPQIRNVVDYLTHVTAEMSIWALSSLGLMPNPLTGLIAADLDQAQFAVESAETLVRLLGGKLAPEEHLGLTQSFIMQFASVAAQLLQQPPQVRLQQIQKVRFCIDAAERFLRLLSESEAAADLATELTRVLGELKLRFLQASGGGGIIG
ncbi:MAG: hypothetical protein HZB16_17725 [Armatimonadetes bacterium]|nr:hypothetical protein [Armatimonadota bacterium]